MTKTAKTTRAALYLRISDDKAGEELGVTRQREDAEQLCAARGWIPEPYIDNDLSAKVADKRPAFKKMLADIDSGEINAVVAWSLDRLARNARDRLALVEACQKRRVVIALVQGSDMDPTTASGRMVIGVLGEVAVMEVELKGERQKRAARQRAEAGKAWTPVRWFGYTMPKPDGTGIEIVESEAALLADAYTGILSGRTLMGIAKEWNELGVTTVKGNSWVATTLRMILLNARNAGIRVYNGEELKQRGDWPQIVPEDVYRGVAAILKDPARTRRPVNGYGRRYLLSGLARCGKCDHTMTGSVARNVKTPRANYICRNCDGVTRSVPDVDAWTIGHVVDYLSRPETIALTAEPDSPEIAELRLTKKALVGRQAELTAALSDPDMPIAEVKAAAAVIREKIAEINARLDTANNDRVLADVLPDEDEREDYYALPEDERIELAQGRFDKLSDDRKRAVIDKLCSVRILPGQGARQKFRSELVPVTQKLA
jgi:site-specific DNA recombinase